MNNNKMIIFWLALLLIYMILGALFRSFIQPVIVLFTIPLGLLGAVYGLFIHGQPMSLMAMIGVVALTGVVETVATVGKWAKHQKSPLGCFKVWTSRID